MADTVKVIFIILIALFFLNAAGERDKEVKQSYIFATVVMAGLTTILFKIL